MPKPPVKLRLKCSFTKNIADLLYLLLEFHYLKTFWHRSQSFALYAFLEKLIFCFDPLRMNLGQGVQIQMPTEAS
jgi:hypothetical protein